MTERAEKKIAHLLKLEWKDKPVMGVHGSAKGEVIAEGYWMKDGQYFSPIDFEKWETLAAVYEKLGMKMMPSNKMMAIILLEKMIGK